MSGMLELKRGMLVGRQLPFPSSGRRLHIELWRQRRSRS